MWCGVVRFLVRGKLMREIGNRIREGDSTRCLLWWWWRTVVGIGEGGGNDEDSDGEE